MKVLFCKNGKIKYKSADGLVFSNKEYCIFYEQKYMWRKEYSQKDKKTDASDCRVPAGFQASRTGSGEDRTVG